MDLSTSAISGNVDASAVRDLPLNGRDWTQLATLQAAVDTVPVQQPNGVNAPRGNRGYGNQMTISGTRPQQNNYRLDGVSFNDYSNGAPGSVVGVDLGVDAIREFSVLTSSYSAEYGRASGGVINAVTRSGGSEFHASLYEFLRNSALDARNFFDGAAPPLTNFCAIARWTPETFSTAPRSLLSGAINSVAPWAGRSKRTKRFSFSTTRVCARV
jgi:hypothetical protein